MSETLEDGERIGRFVLLKDIEGHQHAVSASAVAALYETDDGVILLLSGGRLVHVARSLRQVLLWLDGRGPCVGQRSAFTDLETDRG